MKRSSWYIITGLLLVAISAVLYTLQIRLYHREVDTGFYLLQDFAFLPIQVLLVSLIINGLLQLREQSELQEKMSMVIGLFFTEMGNTLLRYFSEFDVNLSDMRKIARIDTNWSNREFAATRKLLEKHQYTIDCRCADMNDLKKLLDERKETLLQLLSNPNLIEHGTFTQLLWAVSHLTEELSLRNDLDNLPDEDYTHLAADMRRAYVQMVYEWLGYVRQLKSHYPYMFSLVVRMNPFDPDPSAVIEE